MNSMEQAFAAKLRGLRAENRLSQAELADAVGVSADSVSKWEQGTYMPSLSTAIGIANFFGCSLDLLVGRAATA